MTVKKERLDEPVNDGLLHSRRRHFYLSLIVYRVSHSQIKNLTAQPDPRFEITIIGPQNEIAQFKTRGGHPVRKVLAAACRTFGIKYERCVFILHLNLLSSIKNSSHPVCFNRRRRNSDR